MRRSAVQWVLILMAGAGVGAANVRAATEAVHVYAAKAWAGSVERTYFVPTLATDDQVIAFRKELIRKGAQRVNLFVPENIIVCELPPDGRLDDLHVGRGLRTIKEENIDGAGISPDLPLRMIKNSYDQARELARSGSVGRSTRVRAESAGAAPPTVLMRTRENSRTLDELSRAAVDVNSTAAARSVDHNTDILAGDILAQFVFPESRGFGEYTGLESWTEGEVWIARTACVAALVDLQRRFPRMGMNFVFRVVTDVEIDLEPASYGNRGDRDATLWIVETMSALGFGSQNAVVATHEFNNTYREHYGTDWVFTGFIIDASDANSPYVPSTHTYRRYGWLGGPYFVVSYPMAEPIDDVPSEIYFSLGVETQVATAFWAQVENAGTSLLKCDDEYGYLAYKNGNLVSFEGGFPKVCNPTQNCLLYMFDQAQPDRPFCTWTLGHMGVIDADDNDVPDALDATPVIRFEIDGPETVDADEITIRFAAVSRAVSNENPVQMAWERVDYAVPMLSGTISLGGSQTSAFDPVDGVWDEVREDCEMTITGLSEGLTVLQFNVVNSTGLESGIVYKLVYRVGMTFARMETVAHDRGITLKWETVGEVFGARFDVYRQRRGVPETAELMATGVEPLGPPELGIRKFEWNDGNVTPGTEYEYNVDAVFSAVVQNKQLDYHARSSPVAETAMSPLRGNLLSAATPNPFKDRVTVSLSVPPTWNEDRVLAASGVPVTTRQRIATDIRVAVYDVRGSLVRSLFSGPELDDVFTVTWDGRDGRGLPVPSGVYFMKLQAGETINVRKVLLLR